MHLRLACFFAWAALLSPGVMSCATEAPDAVEPLSEACLECLTGREDRGCAGSYDACQAIASCDCSGSA